MNLGIPFSNNKLKTRDFGWLIKKINKKFSHWHIRFLNISGRVELIKTVIYPMLHFWLQVTQFSVTVVQKLTPYVQNFYGNLKLIK